MMNFHLFFYYYYFYILFNLGDMIASFIFHPFKHGWYSIKSAPLSPGGVRESKEPKENNLWTWKDLDDSTHTVFVVK